MKTILILTTGLLAVITTKAQQLVAFADVSNIESHESRSSPKRMNADYLNARITSYNVCYTKLLRAKKGVDYLLEHGEYQTGSPVTYWQDRHAFPKPKQRNTLV